MMKPFLITLCLLLFFTIYLNAQGKSKNVLYENMIVTTVDGTVLPTQTWRNLLVNGRYALKTDLSSSKEEYVIYALTDSAYNAAMGKSIKPKESEYFKIGQPFKIDEIDINGNKLKSKNLKGHILVINFWMIDCPPCMDVIPELNKIVSEFKDTTNITFIGVSIDKKKNLNFFLNKTPFNYQIIDFGFSLIKEYSLHSFPTHVIVDDEGKVYFATSSANAANAYWIKKSILDLLDQRRMVK